MAITFVTTTSYGTWLPGDLRGYVQKGVILPGNPRLLRFARSQLKHDPVMFSAAERDTLFEALLAAADEFDYRLSDATIERWHLHWIAFHGDDPPAVMVGRLKNRMRKALDRGRIWTKSYCGEQLCDVRAIEQTQEYIARHTGCRITNGRIRHEPTHDTRTNRRHDQ